MTDIAPIRTRRLDLRRLAVADVAPLHALMTSPGIRRYLWDDEIVSLSQVRRMLDENATLFASRGFGLWGACPRSDDRLIGFAGLWHFREPPQLEIVFGVAEEAWGQGFGTELARAMTDHAVTACGLSAVVGSTNSANEAARRVLEKCGFAFDRREVVDGIDTVFYVFRP